MQRVAIARALVNNPDIILADEPTGALDSESGLQVMELLKDVAKDRLVIMVTHNGQLAEEYSTRIVNLKDGEIVGDTMPYDSREGLGCDRCGQDADECVCNQDGIFVLPPQKKFFEKLKEKIRKAKAKEKSSMSVATAVNLSWNNLLSKKGRTLLTSIAGSIGIIGIILVLALSNGVNKYIHTLEENALSQYPITIEKSGVSLAAVMDLMTNQNLSNNTEYPDDGVIHVSKMLGLIMEDVLGDNTLFSQNDLQSLKKYIDNNFDTSLGIADEDDPQSIKIYCSSFESKREVEAFLEQYSAKTGNNIKYTDMLAIMMSFVEQMSTTMSNVLVGFAAISLIVSTIMIAIIIYTSVLECRKEIGVLRSLGARKKDISRVFIAESAMLGAYSGVLGLILSLIFAAIGNVILAAVLQIKGLMTVSWWHCVVMFFVSIALSIFAGFIPSRIAAKKDPTVALRSE